MRKTTRNTKIVEALHTLNKTDIYSMMLFTLYKMKDDPRYSTLSELAYIIEGNNLTNFLDYFGGLTITVPTLRDMRKITQAMLLYQYVNIEEKEDFKDAITVVCGDEFSKDEIKEAYDKILEVMSNYDFSRD